MLARLHTTCVHFVLWEVLVKLEVLPYFTMHDSKLKIILAFNVKTILFDIRLNSYVVKLKPCLNVEFYGECYLCVICTIIG